MALTWSCWEERIFTDRTTRAPVAEPQPDFLFFKVCTITLRRIPIIGVPSTHIITPEFVIETALFHLTDTARCIFA